MLKILLLQKAIKLKLIQVKLTHLKLTKKTNKSILGPKKEDIIKDFVKRKSKVKDNKIKTIKDRVINCKTNTKSIMIMMILNIRIKDIKNLYDYIDEIIINQ